MAGVMHAAALLLPLSIPQCSTTSQLPTPSPCQLASPSLPPLALHPFAHPTHPPQAAPAAKPQAIFRKDYTPPPYLVDTVHLNFNLNEDVTHVTSKLALKPNYTPNGSRPALTLNGRPDVKLVEVRLAGG